MGNARGSPVPHPRPVTRRSAKSCRRFDRWACWRLRQPTRIRRCARRGSISASIPWDRSEARGEAVRGQMAVAQVVMNRVFSGKYPNTVCGVVYQNAHRRLHCQFTFACDGIPDVIREPDMWERAKAIAAETLDGKIWLPEVGKATHYHAYWVRPRWVRQM